MVIRNTKSTFGSLWKVGYFRDTALNDSSAVETGIWVSRTSLISFCSKGWGVTRLLLVISTGSGTGTSSSRGLSIQVWFWFSSSWISLLKVWLAAMPPMDSFHLTSPCDSVCSSLPLSSHRLSTIESCQQRNGLCQDSHWEMIELVKKINREQGSRSDEYR